MEFFPSEDQAPRRALVAVVVGLSSAVLFEAVTVLATQDKAIRAASPWQDDPYDAVVSLAQFTVPMLAVVIGLRLLAWGSPGGPERAQQLVRGVAVMIALVGLTAGFEWEAVAARVHRETWNGRTELLIAWLVATSALVVVAVMLLWRARRPRGSSAVWRHDWLGDVVSVCERLPVVRRWATPKTTSWIREHAMGVFTVLSVFAAMVLVGALAAGERWANPLLITWALAVETTSNLAFCVMSNAIAGFIARPPRTRTRVVIETALVTGCVAVQVAVTFRAGLWNLIGGGPLTSVPELVALTVGAGVLVFGVTSAILLKCPRQDSNLRHTV